jgi:hypothetical protein
MVHIVDTPLLLANDLDELSRIVNAMMTKVIQSPKISNPLLISHLLQLSAQVNDLKRLAQ